MMFYGRKFRDYTIALMVIFFGFSALIGLFFDKDYIYKVGSRKIRQKDIFNIGGMKDERSFRAAFMILCQNALIGSECDKLGIVASEKDIKNAVKQLLMINGKININSFDELQKYGYTKEGLVMLAESYILSSHLFYISSVYAVVKNEFVERMLKIKGRKVSGWYKFIRFADSSPEDARAMAKNLINKFNLFGKYSRGYFFSSNELTEFTGVSLGSCFKVQNCSECQESSGGCTRCLANGCLCPDCFDEKNAFEINRETAIVVLSAPLGVLTAFESKEGIVICFVREEEKWHPKREDLSRIAGYYNSLIQSGIRTAYIGDLSAQNKAF